MTSVLEMVFIIFLAIFVLVVFGVFVVVLAFLGKFAERLYDENMWDDSIL